MKNVDDEVSKKKKTIQNYQQTNKNNVDAVFSRELEWIGKRNAATYTATYKWT